MIKRLDKEDVEAFYDFFKSLSEKTKNFFNPHPFDKETAQRLCEEKDENYERFVYYQEGKIVGYIFFSNLKSEYPGIGICIRDGYQGKGLGKKLLSFLIESAEKKEKKGLVLTVFKDNEKAFNLYRKMGFRVEREIYSMKLEF